ncbi:hypothetical protein C2S52_013694 [Perilla frutescens var. hirtella]|uniref:Uncharacterized protein n=1 Tax=Perilla frutescens var. hirtella TaxID=608512 RepID=A0AAD4JHY8_PERFH|nr:hypothetical protein C2S52_013694 [Perilla frutescens var. hirtella]KAH6834097.1 hypothetical protein C2S53_013884 [Perilla frutescens var. hirtella]
MSKTLVVIMATLLVIGTFLPSSLAEAIGYGVLEGGDTIPGSPPDGAANSYNRGCDSDEQCRSRRLMSESGFDNAIEETEEGAEDVKQKIVNLFH